MRNLMAIVEQMDRAATELRSDHPISGRLALILVDNAVELMVHHFTWGQAVWDDHNEPYGIAKLSHAQRAAAKGQRFGDKLEIAKFLGALTEAERRFASLCHGYRNQVYHVGIRHDAIVRSLAAAYFELCCSVMPKMAPRGFGWSSLDKPTEVGRKYFGDPPFGLMADYEHLGPLLLKELPDVPGLPEALRAEAECVLEAMISNFEFLWGDDPEQRSKAEVLRDAQYWWDYGKLLETNDAAVREGKPDQFGKERWIWKIMPKDWAPKFERLPVKSWREQAERIGGLTTFEALDRYEALRKRWNDIEDALRSAADGLDQAIQMQIDMARRK